MDCNKSRSKALKIAADFPGVIGVCLDGDDSDRLAVTGVNVDTVCLTHFLKKKFKSVIIVTVEDMKKAEEEKKKKEEEEEKKRKMKEEKLLSLVCSFMCKKCNRSNCHGKCEGTICSECLSINCGGKCEIFSVECDGNITCVSEGIHQSSINCNGCSSTPPSPCPKGCACSKCYAPVPYQPYQPCYYPYPPQPVYYDSCPDSGCSIM